MCRAGVSRLDLMPWNGQKRRSARCRRNPADKHGCRRHENGYDIALTKAVSSAVNVPVIASGGAGKLEDFYDVLTEGGADAVLAASVFHYKTFTIKQVKEYLRSRGIEVRL